MSVDGVRKYNRYFFISILLVSLFFVKIAFAEDLQCCHLKRTIEEGRSTRETKVEFCNVITPQNSECREGATRAGDPDSGYTTDVFNIVSCFSVAKCLQTLNDGAVSVTRKDSATSVKVGETVVIEVEAVRTRSPGSSLVFLMCLNCGEIGGLSQEGGTGWQSSGPNRATMRLQFDTAEYIGETGTLPAEVKLDFLAELDVSDYPRYGSQEIRIVIQADCGSEIAGMNCTTDQTQPTQLACKQKCEAKNYCKYVNGQCKFDGDVTAQERAQLGEEAVMGWIKEEYAVDPNYQGPIPPCAFTGTCRNTNDFLLLFLRWSKTIFAAIAAFAFTFFVIGGFIILISFGNAEKVKKGQGILGAAVIGMVIVFGAYMMINFLMESLGIRADFRGF